MIEPSMKLNHNLSMKIFTSILTWRQSASLEYTFAGTTSAYTEDRLLRERCMQVYGLHVISCQ